MENIERQTRILSLYEKINIYESIKNGMKEENKEMKLEMKITMIIQS